MKQYHLVEWLHCLAVLVLGSGVRLTHGYCWQAGANPYFIDKPSIQQVSLSKVRISWEGIVEERECADQFLVKYWQTNMPQGFKLSDTVPTDRNHIDVEVIPKVPYQFQVVAREDKGPVLGVDYNKSELREFKTSSLNHESDYVPPKDSEVVVTPAPQPEGPTTASPLEERGQQGVVFNGSLTIELLAVIVVGSFIGLIIIVGIVYRCIRGSKSVSSGYSDPEDVADDLPDLSDREDLEAGEGDDLKHHMDTEL